VPKPDIKGLFYITHVNNIKSILRHGILSHALVEARKVQFTPIYDAQIVSNRRERKTPNGKSLWDYANLYFQPRNPMLYRVINEKDKKDIAIVEVRPDILKQPDVFVSTGNAASLPSDILPVKDGLKEIHQMWKVINSEWWNDTDGSKRKIMAECLAPELVPPALIQAIYVVNHAIAEKLRSDVPPQVQVIPEPHMFFQPTRRSTITQHMFLVEGDMFFSNMQTLTVSVNTVGIMGKGLASRAKYQFPDVYVVYQDACRSKKLQMGKPYLYKRESFVDEELADEPSSLSTPNSSKWFLLFATKKHWRENSDMAGIEQGLQWVKDKYKIQGIKSLAVPALGCGLGGLEWKDVGPLICQHLVDLDIPVAIYLPREKEIPAEYLTGNFLLGK
jgi:O-acetyl-ADP-ribose deacetylase (regulator of RNase III)